MSCQVEVLSGVEWIPELTSSTIFVPLKCLERVRTSFSIASRAAEPLS